MHTKLTKRVLEVTRQATTAPLFLRDTELRGFGARVSPHGSITFFAEGRLKRGRNKRVSLGRYPVLTVEEARERARKALYKLSAGIDPVGEAKAQAEADQAAHALVRASSVTLAEVMDDYFRSRPIKSEPAYRGALKNSFGDWLNRPVRAITRQDVESRYRKIAFTNGHKAQAAKAMRCLSAICNFAKGELIAGQPLLFVHFPNSGPCITK
ncbi:MAG: Arm DNA-binding domain-containing protein [Gammaproteobacteria bacterium]